MNVQRIVWLALFTLSALGTSLSAQQPQKIYGIAKEQKTTAYYQEQARLWQKEVDKEQDNAKAWYNLFLAQRAYLQLTATDIWPNQKTAFYARLQPLVNEAQQAIGNSFEYYCMKGMNTDGAKAIAAFEQAHALAPDRPEVYGWLLTHYYPLFDEAKLTYLAPRMLKANIYSNANLTWNYNGLQSVAPNGVFISNGDMDGIPKWVLQYGAGIRKDVLVVSKWLLADKPAYRNRIFQQLGMKPLSKTIKDFPNLSAYSDYLMAEVLKQSKRPAYVSAGTPMEFFRTYNMENQIYLVGNALHYSKQPFDNTAVIEQNMMEKYYLEYLFNNFQQHWEDEVVKKQMNLTYLPALMHLKKHYQANGQAAQLAYCEKLINQIAVDSGRKEEILKWFE